MSWRNVAIALALLCLYQWYRGCTASPAQTAQVECPTEKESATRVSSGQAGNWDSPSGHADHNSDTAEEPAPQGPQLGALKLPAWTLFFAPHPGESMLAYRDRMVPIAQTLLAPHRERVARSRDDLAKKIGLDSQQRAQLDGAVNEAATQIEDKVMNAFMSGDLNPATFKPMTGVTLARDVLDSVAQANQRFMNTLREDQKATLAKHPFDFADYMLFSARWEDALGVTN